MREAYVSASALATGPRQLPSAATGALVEVPNTTNLSTVVADFLAIGP